MQLYGRMRSGIPNQINFILEVEIIIQELNNRERENKDYEIQI
jgi:hypothetical protein